MEYKDITQHEIEALKHDFNLSDAHTHQSQSSTQKEIVGRLPQLWYEAENTRQYDMEQKFLKNFFRVQKQEWALKNNNCLLVYASSIAMVITANYLMKKNMSVSLMHPCFDNLTDILRNMKVPISPLEESWLSDPEKIYVNLEKNVKTDALFFVDPNNPTGFTLFSYGKKAWSEVIRYAKDYNKLLLMDFCFASFMLPDKDLDVFDLYELLETSGVSYIAYEDTGKTWPLQDTKVAILKTSKDLYEDVFNIHTSYLLNVSPFILNVVTQYILDSEKDNFASVFGLLERNRKIATKILQGSILQPIVPITKVSVLWCRIKDSNIKATELKAYLEKSGIHVLPGTYFFWNDKETGDRFIRIALARNTGIFQAGMLNLRKVIDEY
ncbi:MAG TPA: pyridoxal phosphate-dependent aminotransferase [Candidatus Paceibacterota bacterium]|nr:pyridoxal phosphate-dependent aminotransferase [Candidatus Paceibacterota bacterium]